MRISANDLDPATEADAFWSLVDQAGSCWLWRGTVLKNGYGQFRARGYPVRAHRAAWVFSFGPIPDGLFVMHLCDQRACCRPSHLVLGSHAANMADMVLKGRQATGARNAMRRDHGDRLRGSRNGFAKLTESDVHSIRVRYAAGGVTLAMLAGEYGVTLANISSIVRRKTWQHLP